jgi:hypothetical protein
MLANTAGFELTFRSRDAKPWNDASRIGFMNSDHTTMALLNERRLTPLPPSDAPAKARRRSG